MANDFWVPAGRPTDRTAKHGLVIRDWNGRPAVGWPFKVPHVQVVGSSGGGKSSLARALTTNLIRITAGVERDLPQRKILQVVLDGKGANSFLMLEDQPGVIGLYSGFEQALEAARGVQKEMNRRYKALDAARDYIQATGRPPEGFVEPPELVFTFDEYMVALGRLMRDDEDLALELVDILIDLGQLARDAKISLVLMMQRGDSKVLKVGLPGVLKDQLKAKFAVYGDVGFAPLEARMAFGENDARSVMKQIRPELGAAHVQIGGYHGRILVPWMADPLDYRTSAKDRADALSLLPVSVKERKARSALRVVAADNVVDMSDRQVRLGVQSTQTGSARQPTGGVKGSLD